MKLILATRNQGKLKELKRFLGDLNVELSLVSEFEDIAEAPELGETFFENAREKARIVSVPGYWSLADDSGICVAALDGAPGVHSALYAGPERIASLHNEKLLREMCSIPRGKRQATFVCTMVLRSPDGKEWEVEGRCEGEVALEANGANGFGYDPIFFVPSKNRTMAELTPEEKFEVSHRGHALRQIREILVEVLKEGQ